MPFIRRRFNRLLGVADNSELQADQPSPWKLPDGACIDSRAWAFREGRPAQRPSQLGSAFASWSGKSTLQGLMQAVGAGYNRPLAWNSYGVAQHCSSGAWAALTGTVASTGNPVLYQGANGLGVTLLPFGGTSALQKYTGGTSIAAVGGTALTGLGVLAFFRLSNRFLGIKDGDDNLYYCSNNDYTAWTTGDGNQEPVGNDRNPLTTLGEGPGDLSTLFKRDYVFVIEKTDPANWNIRRKTSDRGAVGVRAWCRGPNGAIWFAHDSGIWLLNDQGGISAQPLTAPIERLWSTLFTSFPAHVQYMSLCYHPWRQELMVLVPKVAGRPRRLWRCYVPDGSWGIEDEITSGTIWYSLLAELQDADGLRHPYFGQEDATGDTVKVFQVNGTGAYSGAYVRPKPEGDPLVIKRFGTAPEAPAMGGKMVLYLKARGSYSAQVTTTVWKDDGTQVVSGPHTVSVAGTAGRPIIAEVPCPEDEGTWIDVKVANVNQDEIVDLEGYDIPYDISVVGSRRL